MNYIKMSNREISLLLAVIEDRLNGLDILGEDEQEVQQLENLKIMLLNAVED